MKKLENILAENMLRFNTKNLNEDEIPNLDPDTDSAQTEKLMSQLEQAYTQVKPKRLDMSEFSNDVHDLISIYKDKSGPERQQQYYKAFFDLYPIATTNRSWKGYQNDIMQALNRLANLAKDIDKGDTSNYMYRNM